MSTPTQNDPNRLARPRPISRRHLLRRAAAAGVVAPSALASLTRPGVGLITAAAQAQSASKVSIALSTDINTLDPHQTATVGTDLSVISHLYTSLVLRGPDLKLQPALATSWQATSATTWTFKLRDDVVFPDGEKLDASAVKWNVDRVLNPATKARIRSWFDLVKEARAVDATTVQFITSAPYPALVDQLSMFFLLAPKWASQHQPASEAMGTGPYDFVEWVKDDHVSLKAKTTYWGAKPPFQNVTFHAVPEVSSRVSGLLAGDYDVVTGINPTDIKRITDSKHATAGAVASTRTAMVKFNTLKAPFANQQLRQALNYAVDKQGLIEAFFPGLDVQPSQGQVLTPEYFGYNSALKPYPFDVAKAKALMKSAGAPDSIDVEFDLPTGTYLLAEEITQAIAGGLAEVGVNAKVSAMPFSTYMNKYLPQRNLAPMAYITQAWPTLDADGLLTLFESGNQYAYWDDAQFSKLLEQARSTLDAKQRLALYQQATAVMREAAPVIFLFPQPATYGVVNTISWKARPDDWVRVWEMKPAG